MDIAFRFRHLIYRTNARIMNTTIVFNPLSWCIKKLSKRHFFSLRGDSLSRKVSGVAFGLTFVLNTAKKSNKGKYVHEHFSLSSAKVHSVLTHMCCMLYGSNGQRVNISKPLPVVVVAFICTYWHKWGSLICGQLWQNTWFIGMGDNAPSL